MDDLERDVLPAGASEPWSKTGRWGLTSQSFDNMCLPYQSPRALMEAEGTRNF